MKDKIRDYSKTISIDAVPEQIFLLLTTLEGLTAWWANPVTGNTGINGELNFNFSGNEDRSVMRVDTAMYPSRVEWTVIQDTSYGGEWEGTRIIFNIEAVKDGKSRLHFLHAGLTPDLQSYEDCVVGWDHYLNSIKELSTVPEKAVGE